MKLSDLKVGMVVESRADMRFIVLKDNEGRLFGAGDRCYIGGLYRYENDMTFIPDKNQDICKVYEIKNAGSLNGYNCILQPDNLKLLWERKEPKEIPMTEVMEILAEKLGCKPDEIKITG